MRWPNAENCESGKVESSLLSLNRKILNVSLISLFTDSNLFRREFILRCPRKTFLRYLLLKSLMVLKRFFILVELNFFLLQLIISLKILYFTLTCALCEYSSLLKANSNICSMSLLFPLLFKWIPLLLQLYLGFMFELSIKQIFLLVVKYCKYCRMCNFISLVIIWSRDT